MTDADLEILQHMMNGGKPPDFAIRLLEDICKRTGLDWKARHVYLQKRRTKTGEAWQAVLSIDGFRTVGARHPQYAGQEGPFWVVASNADWSDIPPDNAPYAAKVGIRKKLEEGETTTTWGVAKYKDYYAGMMWDKFPSTMIAKCAEMLAWRKTFPETFGGLYGDAEMAQQHPKTALQMSEVLDEVPVEPAKPAVENLREQYVVRLKEAKGGAEVKAIGKEISADKRLEVAEVAELHMLYTKMKNKYEKEGIV